jgi:hypothetical protein
LHVNEPRRQEYIRLGWADQLIGALNARPEPDLLNTAGSCQSSDAIHHMLGTFPWFMFFSQVLHSRIGLTPCPLNKIKGVEKG